MIRKPLAAVAAVAVLAILATSLWAAREHVVGQKDRMFSTNRIEIQVGDTVSFPNHDDFFHNVYSLSPTKIFDLGSYPKGQTRKVIFDKPGRVEVLCAIHPEMRMEIIVK